MTSDSFAHRLEQFGTAVAVWLPDGQKISYQTLAALADQYLAQLKQQIKPQQLLALRFAASLPALVAYLAALRGGYPLLLLSADVPITQQKAVINNLAVHALLDQDGEVALTGLQQQVRPDCALLLSTSGSTGTAKAVMLSLQNLEANAYAICTGLPIQAADTAITALPLHYSYGLSVLNSHLYQGAAILLTTAPIISQAFWQQMRQFSISSLAGVPFSYQLFRQLRLERMHLPALRYLTQAGGKADTALQTYLQQLSIAWQKPVFLMYGQTEATARIAILPAELLATHADCIGEAIAGGELLLRDPITGIEINQSLCTGVLCYRGPNVMLGYACKASDLQQHTMLAELNTGDLAERLPDGLYRIVGRLSRLIKLRGKRLQLDELEQLFAQNQLEVVATGQDDQLLLATSNLTPVQMALMEHLLRQQCDLHPSLYQIKTGLTLPRLPNGKIDYPALQQCFSESAC